MRLRRPLTLNWRDSVYTASAARGAGSGRSAPRVSASCYRNAHFQSQVPEGSILETLAETISTSTS